MDNLDELTTQPTILDRLCSVEAIVEAVNRMEAVMLQDNAKGMFSNDFVMCVGKAKLAIDQIIPSEGL